MADKKVVVTVGLTSELNKAIIDRADKEGKSLDDVIFEVLLKEFAMKEVN
jgi:hypothetical protein